MDAETALIIESCRRRRLLTHRLLVEMGRALIERQPMRVARLKGKREVGLALFQRYRRVRSTSGI